MTTVAVMQPYLWPYAGYYRLLAGADVFVVFDCVQFVRRGRIHRNQFDAGGRTEWLTLPLAKPVFDARIDAVSFHADAAREFEQRARPFARLARGLATLGLAAAPQAGAPLADFLCAHLEHTARWLGIDCAIQRSSRFALPPEVRGEERILALCERLGARRYINVAGGRTLYDAQRFRARGVELRFLAPYQGPFESVQERLADTVDVARQLRAEIGRNLIFS